MDTTPLPVTLTNACKLPWKPGRSAEVFVDGDLEVRFTPKPTNGMQAPHERDELYFVASGRAFYRVDDRERTAVGPGDLCFCAAHHVHGFEDISQDFALWIIFYGPKK